MHVLFKTRTGVLYNNNKYAVWHSSDKRAYI